MAFTPVELEKGGVQRIADDADEEARLRWDGWLPTGTPVPVSTFDDKVRDLVADKTSATAVEMGAAFVAGAVLNNNGTASTTKRLTVKLTADGLDIEDLIIENV